MSILHVKNNRNATLVIDGSGDRYIIDQGVTIHDPDIAIQLKSTANNNSIEVRGTLRCEEDSIVNQGNGTNILVAATGKLIGDDGIFSVNNTAVTNRGQITLMGDGISFYDEGYVTNFGTIKTGSSAVSIGSGRVDNLEGASIRSDTRGISSVSGSLDTITIYNEGLIVGKQGAIIGLDGRELVFNYGEMRGKIDLGKGDDTFDTRKGIVDHDIVGGDGNDTLWTSNGTVRLVEAFGEGSDIVKSTVSYTLGANVEKLVLLGSGNITGKGNDSGNGITGNSANNKLYGEANNDFLDGKAGNDILSGGATAGDEDTFYFKTGYDHDRIIDFQDDTDKLALKGLKGVTDFNDLTMHHVSDNGSGELVITAGDDRLTVHGLSVATLTSNDVYFD